MTRKTRHITLAALLATAVFALVPAASAKCFVVLDSRPWQGSETARAQTLCLVDELDRKTQLDGEIARLQGEIDALSAQRQHSFTYSPANVPSYVPISPAF